MLVLSSDQIRIADEFTIKNLPVLSLDLMEKAAKKCFNWILENYGNKRLMVVVCGSGNNGGDGFALARMLHLEGYKVNTVFINPGNVISPECKVNMERLIDVDSKLVTDFSPAHTSEYFRSFDLVIDCIFGIGLSRTITGETADLIRNMNGSHRPILSIDIPSGIYSDKSSEIIGHEKIIATDTLTFQYHKKGLLVEENSGYYGQVHVLDIGLLEDESRMGTCDHVTDRGMLRAIFRPKKRFSHKGTYGHGLLVCGSHGMMGAAILSARAFLRSGAGLLTTHVPGNGLDLFQSAVAESMAITEPEPSLEKFTAIGIGPGLGTSAGSTSHVEHILRSGKPLVIDADALNIISQHQELLKLVPKNSVLTPHPGEFKRLAGTWTNDFEKLELQRSFAMQNQVIIVLKGHHSTIAFPDGRIIFNPTGNAGMAKGGSGDVLTGLVTGLITSGYNNADATVLGTWLHGTAGDLAAAKLSQEGMNAGDIVDFIPEAWKRI